MSSEKTLALVLRVIEFSETSSIVTIFTRDFGKISALAKGARRPKGPFESALDLLSLCRIVFLRKSSDALDLLTEAKLERRFRLVGRDLSHLYAAYYLAELLNELTDAADPHPELFDAAESTLLALGRPEAVVGALVLRFELMALRLLGHAPSLEACVECGRTVGGGGRVAFGLLAGGVLCAEHRPGKKQVVSISETALKTLIRFAAPDSQEWQNVEFVRAVRGEVRGVLNQYLCNLLGHRPRMHSYLGVLSE